MAQFGDVVLCFTMYGCLGNGVSVYVTRLDMNCSSVKRSLRDATADVSYQSNVDGGQSDRCPFRGS